MTILDLWQHAGEDLQAKVLFVPQSVRTSLDNPDLGVDSLDEPQGELLLGLAVRRDPAPSARRHLPLFADCDKPQTRFFKDAVREGNGGGD